MTAGAWSPPGLADAVRDPATLTEDGTVLRRWARTWHANPGARVLAFAGLTAWITARELDERTAGAAAVLGGHGLRPGDRVLWRASPAPDAVLAAIGVLRAGGALVPVAPGASGREVAVVADDVRPVLALGEPGDPALTEALRCPVVDPVTLAPAPGTAAAPAALDAAAPEDPALVVYTSGTTGSPKGVVLSHRNLLAGTRAIGVAWAWEPGDRLALALPLSHVHGLCAGLFGSLVAGASAVLYPRFDPGSVLRAPRDAAATVFFGVPTMYHRLAAHPDAASLGSFRLCVSGSAPLAPALFERVRQASGVTLLERYGMTETLLTLSNPLEGPRVPGTVGFPLPGVEARLAPELVEAGDPEEGAPLLVRGPSVFAGYWERASVTAEAIDGAGWFSTGDLATRDPEGRYRIVGRAGDLIISGGHNVSPAEVEAVLAEYPGVADVAVTGEPSEEWGERVVAWVVPAAPFNDDVLLAFAAEQLSPPKRPVAVRRVATVPRNALGKVLRDQLR